MRRGRAAGVTTRARRLRNEPTSAERAAWRVLRELRTEGIHVRRQHPLGRYVADFVNLKEKLVIEFDGPVHELFRPNDEARDAWLIAEGFRVLRLPNKTAFDPDGLADIVRKACTSRLP